MPCPFLFLATNEKGERFQILVFDDALCGAFVGKTAWLNALNAGANAAQGPFGLLVFALLLPAMALALRSLRRSANEVAAFCSSNDSEFTACGARDFRISKGQMKAVGFSPPKSGARFTDCWTLDVHLTHGESRHFLLHERGVPRAARNTLRALKIPVDFG